MRLFLLLMALSFNAFSSTSTTANVAFDPVANAAAYQVCWSETVNTLGTCSSDITATTYSITGLGFNKNVFIAVKSKDAAGNYSALSPALSFQTISVFGTFNKTTGVNTNEVITLTPVTTGDYKDCRLDAPGSIEGSPRFWAVCPATIPVSYATEGTKSIGLTVYAAVPGSNPRVNMGATDQNVSATVTVSNNCQ